MARLLALAALLALAGGLTAGLLTREAGGQHAGPPSAGEAPKPTPAPDPTTTGTSAPPPAETAAERARGDAPGAAPPVERTRWRSRAHGLALAYPGDWHVRTDGVGFGHLRLCFELASDRRTGLVDARGSRTAPDGVEIRLVEAFGGPRGPDTRARFRLERLTKAGVVAWTRGGAYTFRRHQRWFGVGVLLGPDAPADAVAAAERAVASLVVARSGRCLPPASSVVRWRSSRPLGAPHAGRLLNGVQVPAEGRHFFTWDPILHRKPDRPGRRWGTDGVVRTTLRIVERFAASHPSAPRVGIGDLSRRRGGDFGPRHVSHQNGLDVDVYYPRKDGKERPPRTPAQVDRRLAQELVDRFVAAGATTVFVGPNVGLTGPRRVVQELGNHDNHLHARFPPGRA